MDRSARSYPSPDRLLDRLPVSRAPGWYTLNPSEQSLRGRYYLIAVAAGIQSELAWFYAMKPEALDSIERDIGHLTDEQIEAMINAKVWRAVDDALDERVDHPRRDQ
jgi:hypothetical protein